MELPDKKWVSTPTLLANLEDLFDPDIKRICSCPLAKSGESVFLGLEVVPDIVNRIQLPFNAKALLDFGVFRDSVDAPVQGPVCIKQSGGNINTDLRVTSKAGRASSVLTNCVQISSLILPRIFNPAIYRYIDQTIS